MPDEQNTETQPVAFDPAAFRAEILGEFNKTLNGFAKTFKTDIGKMLTPPVKETAVETQQTHQETQTQDGKQKDPHVAGLELRLKNAEESFQKRIQEMEKREKEASDKAERENRESLVRSKLSKMNIREDAFDDAFSVFSSQVRRDDEGGLIAGDLPYDQYIETQLKGPKAYMLKPIEVNGSDAARGQRINGKAVTLESIRPGMSKEETQAAMQQIVATL